MANTANNVQPQQTLDVNPDFTKGKRFENRDSKFELDSDGNVKMVEVIQNGKKVLVKKRRQKICSVATTTETEKPFISRKKARLLKKAKKHAQRVESAKAVENGIAETLASPTEKLSHSKAVLNEDGMDVTLPEVNTAPIIAVAMNEALDQMVNEDYSEDPLMVCSGLNPEKGEVDVNQLTPQEMLDEQERGRINNSAKPAHAPTGFLNENHVGCTAGAY